MAAEYRVFGPPGTGKTTWLAAQVARAVEKHPPDLVYACSFTRAAAVELASRNAPIPPENVGTIHSICWHRLGRPTIVEVNKELLAEWSARHPQFTLKAKGSALDEPPEVTTHLMEWNRERATLGKYRTMKRDFAQTWEAFKAEHDAVDFTDLMLKAPESLPAEVLFVDEAQDLTALQWRVVRRWGASCETLVVVGDDDQMIYEFLGADAADFLTDLPDEQKRYLGHSHRLSRAVWERAEGWIGKLGEGREPKVYEPRADGGECAHRELTLASPDRLVAEALDRAGDGQTVMVLASCGYMLRPLIDALRNRGAVFHNPYRPKRGDWNPLRSTARRLLAFEECSKALHSRRGADGTPASTWSAWMSLGQADVCFQRGAKAEVKRMAADDGTVSEGDLDRWLRPESFDALVQADVRWLAGHATAERKRGLDYPLAVWERGGFEALRAPPKLVVGTIHSVKGGEADVVYLFPDLSIQARRALDRDWDAGHGATVRQFYVGMTRARDALFLCSPSAAHFVNW